MKYFLSIILVATVLLAKAQQIEWGLKAGLQVTQFRGDDFLGRLLTSSTAALDNISSKGGNTTGYVVGGYVRGTENVFLQGEMLLSVKGAALKNTTNGTVTTMQYGQLDIPFSLGVRHKRLEITGGPVLAVQLFDDNNLKGFLSNFSTSPLGFSPYRKYSFGYQAGAAANFNKLTIGLRYMASIQPISDMYISYLLPGDTQSRQSRFQQRFSSVQVTAAYRLSK